METIKEAGDLQGKHVLVRADFNVPVGDGAITDDTRIRETLPTIEHLCDQGAKTVLCAHLGRPKGEPADEFRLDPVAERLSELLDTRVENLGDCVGDEAKQAVDAMDDGDVVFLENTRFHPEEKENDADFARQLADVYVNDASLTAPSRRRKR